MSMAKQIKEEPWEILPYSEESDEYCIWVDEFKGNKRVFLSNSSDCCEYIQIESSEFAQELIEKLMTARDWLRKREK